MVGQTCWGKNIVRTVEIKNDECKLSVKFALHFQILFHLINQITIPHSIFPLPPPPHPLPHPPPPPPSCWLNGHHEQITSTSKSRASRANLKTQWGWLLGLRSLQSEPLWVVWNEQWCSDGARLGQKTNPVQLISTTALLLLLGVRRLHDQGRSGDE